MKSDNPQVVSFPTKQRAINPWHEEILLMNYELLGTYTNPELF